MGYQIRLCNKDEYKKLIYFIKDSWNKNHIFVKNKLLLDCQHINKDKYNFIVANHEETNSFHAILGFISPGFYSNSVVSIGDDIWLAIWKVNKNSANESSLGIKLLQFIETKYKPRTISAIGINKEVEKLYRLLGFEIEKMSQYFIKNPQLSEFKIASFLDKNNSKTNLEKKLNPVKILEVNSSSLLKYSGLVSANIPKKEFGYLVNRFIKHPIYKYRYFLVIEDTLPTAIFVARKIYIKNNSCIRIIDFFSIDELKFSLKKEIEKILIQENSEYIDLINFGTPNTKIEQLGFSSSSELNILPHLFEPFVKEKQEVRLAFRPDYPFVAFKGDGDLDRPNI